MYVVAPGKGRCDLEAVNYIDKRDWVHDWIDASPKPKVHFDITGGQDLDFIKFCTSTQAVLGFHDL